MGLLNSAYMGKFPYLDSAAVVAFVRERTGANFRQAAYQLGVILVQVPIGSARITLSTAPSATKLGRQLANGDTLWLGNERVGVASVNNINERVINLVVGERPTQVHNANTPVRVGDGPWQVERIHCYEDSFYVALREQEGAAQVLDYNLKIFPEENIEEVEQWLQTEAGAGRELDDLYHFSGRMYVLTKG